MTDILGQGLKFPFQFSRQSGGTRISTATSRAQDHIHESIRQILSTRPGERFLRPDFGSRLPDLLFEGNDTILQGLLRHEVIDALTRWEPRINIDAVGIVCTNQVVQVNIAYRLITTQVPGNLVLPFTREVA